MRARKALTIAVGCALVAFASASKGRCADAPPAAPAGPTPEQRKLLEQLKNRVGEWMEARKNLVGACRTCLGSGRQVWLAGGRTQSRPCSKCSGTGKVFSRDGGRKLLYDLRSPAWRSRDTAQEEANVEFKAWKLEDAWKLAPKKWTFDHGDLLDATHAVAHVVEGNDSVTRSSRWVLATEPLSKKTTWFRYEPISDGEWPGDPSTAGGGASRSTPDPFTPAPPTPPASREPDTSLPVDPVPLEPSPAAPPPPPARPKPPPEPPKPAEPPKPPPPPPVDLSEDARKALGQALAMADVKPDLVKAATAGDALVLTLQTKGARNQEGLDDVVAKALVPTTRAALRVQSNVTSVRLVFLAKYVDRFGEVSAKPYVTMSISREDFDRTHWENLTHGAMVDQFLREDHVYRLQGFTFWWKD